MFRTVLVHVDHLDASAARVKFAIDVARQFDATLIGMTAGVPHLPIEVYDAGLGTVGIGPEYSTHDREHLKAEFGSLEKSFRDATAKSGLEVDWRAAFDSPSAALARAATLADLMILGAGDISLLGDLTAVSAGDVVLHAGRPVLVAPKGAEKLQVGTAMVAWKNSPESQRALSDALPFLKRAATVAVVQACRPGAESDDLAEPTAFLLRHGIATKHERVEHDGSDVETALIGRARDLKADLIVAGAYGHTRLREWVFGGVTRGLLSRSPVPCLFSH